MEVYGQETPPEIDLKTISSVPIAMFAGIQDKIVGIEDNRWVKSQLNTLHLYKEIDFDHLSFLLADDMSYFDDVIAVIMEKNPVNELVNKYEKKMAKKYLDEEQKHKQKILEQKAIKEKMKILEEESIVSTLSEMKSDPFEVLGFWGSGENENLYMLEYLKE